MSVMSARAKAWKKPSIFSYHKIVSSTVMANMYAVCIYVVVDRQAGDITFQLYIKFLWKIIFAWFKNKYMDMHRCVADTRISYYVCVFKEVHFLVILHFSRFKWMSEYTHWEGFCVCAVHILWFSKAEIRKWWRKSLLIENL